VDGDAQSRTTLYSNQSADITNARYAPVISLTDHIVLPATGALTSVDIGTVTAHDNQDGEVEPALTTIESNGEEPIAASSTQLDLMSGNHLLTWTATDSAGNTSEAAQLISIEPILQFSEAYTRYYEDKYACPLRLSGQAAKYPVSVSYSLIGNKQSDSSEVTLYEDTLLVDGHESPLEIPIYDFMFSYSEPLEDLRLVISQVSNGVLGDLTSCEVIFANTSTTPKASLSITQNNKLYRIPVKNYNSIIATVTLSELPEDLDPNQASYEWWLSDDGVADTDSADTTYTIDPASVQPGLYEVGVTVTIGSYQISDKLSFLVTSGNPDDFYGDSDQDGVVDYPDGPDDTDQDGVPNYLDHANLPRNKLQIVRADGVQLINSDPSTDLFLGNTALQAQTHGALITANDIVTCAQTELCGTADTENPTYYAGLYDFQIKDLPGDNSPVHVVIPQQSPIEANSVFRLLTTSGWQTFQEDSNNSVKSATTSNGFCPPPQNSNYQTRLQQADTCIELKVEDGGPNDADGQLNGRILIMGGLVVSTTPVEDGSTEEENTSDPDDTQDSIDDSGDSDTSDEEADSNQTNNSSSGGGGAIAPLLLLMIILYLTLITRRRDRDKRTKS
jgi:hypothetical protein